MAFRSSTSITPTSANSVAIAVPSGAAVGDIAVVGLYKENTAAVTPASGFTQKAALTTSGTARGTLYVFWKRLTAADSGTYTFNGWTGNPFVGGACALFSGRIASGDPFDGTVGTAESTTAVSTLNVSTSPTGANGDAVGMWTNFNGGATWSPPTNYTERVDTNVITLDTRDAVASGTTGNVSATATISDFEKAFLGVLAVASSGTTGTVAATQADNTSSASGTVANPITGTASPTQSNNTASASGVLGYTGTIAVTQAANTSTASGSLIFTGTVSVTQASNTASATGKLGYTGTVAAIQAANTSSASGTVASSGFSGSVAVTQASQTSNTSGVLKYSGTVTVVQAGNTAAATGILGYTGTLARTQANQTATATGVVANPVTGTVTVIQASQTSAASGTTQALVLFGTSSAGIGVVPAAHPNAGLAPYSVPGSGAAPSASGSTTGVPTSTGA